MRVATVVLIACVLAVGLLGGNVEARGLETAKRCASETQLNEMPIKDIFSHGEEPNKKIKCFVACIAREDDVLVHGKFNKDKIFETLPDDFPNRDKVVELLAKCSDEKGSDDCETAYLGVKCLRDNRIPLPLLLNTGN
ncbi:GSCOCG00005420001-RA-CDS [Cotesia congregata]|uniref:Similar to Obp56h: General odorant-binding protein 56h (Drosophila melanogaster) n=1 Tax=Cotesia congregata TaxID=51543 RepID=A0A8J2MGB4_COTCN|nr:GSCOCG00005420001-RA-CDS [Cotesia congregata]CAG5078132.1 Similar to Obp56h: General odorant-binding protein 56h (Drosophila melanogaster) [Cotesia congregata]